MGWNKPRSKADFRAMAKKNHMCLSCFHYQTAIFVECPKCGVKGMREYFPSMVELSRASTLIHMQLRGDISNLRFHPKYDLIVEGVKVCRYEGDSEYRQNGKTVVEDVKANGDFMEDLAKLKIALFDALHAKHGIKVKIYRDA
jgi:hypothetical protein